MRAAPGGTSTGPYDLAVSSRGCGRNLPCGSPRQRYFPTISRTFSASSFERANRSFAKIARTSSMWVGVRSTIFTALKGDIMGISMSSFTIGGTLSAGTRANSDAWEREYCCSGLSSPRAAFSFSRMTFSSARETTTASMILPPKRTSTRNDPPRRPTTVPVMPWKRWCGQPRWTLESMTIVTCSPSAKVWNDRVIGESPRSRGLRRNFCRVFSMIPFEAFTIGSPVVVDVQDVELDHLAGHPQPLREGRRGPSAVPVDPLLDVGPRLRRHADLRAVSDDPDDLGRQDASMPRGIRTPVNDPFGGLLGDRLRHQNWQGRFKLCFPDGRDRPEENAVRLRRAILFQPDDVGAARRREPVDLDDPGRVDAGDRRSDFEMPAARLLDLDDERTTTPEHPGDDVLAAHPVQGVAGAAGLPHDLRRNDLLNARRVHLARPAAPRASFAHAPPARPPGLRHAPGELSVAAPQVERVHLQVHMVEGGIEDRDDVGRGQVRFLADPLRDALPDFAVHLRFQRLWRGEPEVGPKRLLPGGDLRIDSRADAESVVLPGLELSRDEVREGVVAGRQPRAHPARPGGVACDLPDRPAPFLVRMPVADLAEEAAEAGVAQHPIAELRPIDRASGGEDLVHGPPQRPGGLQAHASRNTLTRRFSRTIPVTPTYVRSRSSANERKLSTTRATGVKIISRIPRFRYPAGVKRTSSGTRFRAEIEFGGMSGPPSPLRTNANRMNATETTTPPRRT